MLPSLKMVSQCSHNLAMNLPFACQIQTLCTIVYKMISINQIIRQYSLPQNGMQTPEIESKTVKPPIGCLALPTSHRAN